MVDKQVDRDKCGGKLCALRRAPYSNSGQCEGKKVVILRGAIERMKQASVFKKALAAEAVLLAAVALIEAMVDQI